MRSAIILSVFTIIAFMPYVAFADEFGERFYSETPSGLGEYNVTSVEIQDIAMDEVAEDLQDVMPAAGEESENIAEDTELEVEAEAPVQTDIENDISE